MNAKARKPFFGWWVVAAGFFIMATCYTAMVNGMSLFQPHIVSDLGITVGEYNTANSLSTLVSIVGALVIGGVVDRFPGRVLGGISVLITALVLIGFSQVSELWQLMLFFAIDGLVVIAGTRLLISIVVTNWFVKKRGLAVALALSGSGFGGAVLSPIISGLIVSFGWRTAFMVLAGVCFVLAFPITVATFYSRPAAKGLEPYGIGATAGAKDSSGGAAKVTETAVVDIPWKIVRKHYSFFLVVAGFFIMGILNGAAIPNSITNITSVVVDGQTIVTGGHDAAFASMFFSFNMVVVIAAKIGTGAVYDRFGVRAGVIMGSFCCIAGLICMCFPATDIAPMGSALFFGIGTCMGTVAPPLVAAKLFGAGEIGKVTGWLTSLQMLGYALGTITSGRVFDLFLSFAPMWAACAVGGVAMLALLLASEPAAKRLAEKVKAEKAALEGEAA